MLQTYIGNSAFADGSGVLLIFEGALGIWFRRHPHQFRSAPLLIELPSMKRLNRERHEGVPITAWNMYGTRDDWEAKREPLFEFRAPKANS